MSMLLLTGCTIVQQPSVRQGEVQRESLYEYCFDLREREIRMEKVTTFVDEYQAERGVAAAMNGMYWGADDGEPQGVAHTAREGDVATGKGLVSGYFMIDEQGPRVSENLDEELDEYEMVIGTHPLLVQDGAVHEQALGERYNRQQTFRSALGAKSQNEACFVVSGQVFTMHEWAQLLVDRGYEQVINLDGGPVAQLATPEGLFGLALQETRLVLFVE